MAKFTASEARQAPTRRLECWITRHRVRAWSRVSRLAETKTRSAYDRLVDLERA